VLTGRKACNRGEDHFPGVRREMCPANFFLLEKAVEGWAGRTSQSAKQKRVVESFQIAAHEGTGKVKHGRVGKVHGLSKAPVGP